MWPLLSAAALVALVLLHLWWRRQFLAAQEFAQQELSKLAAQQNQMAAQALAEKEALFNSMVEGVLVLDRNGRVRLANRALGTLFSVPSDIVGKTLLEALRIHELAAVASRVAAERQVPAFEITLPGIEQRIFEVSAAAVLNEKGEQEGAILVFHDLTRIKKLENTRQEFVANVSHELRTPLSLIKGYVETLIDGAKDKPDVAERFLRTIERNADRLSLLIEDLLTISRLESGKTILNFTRLDLHAAVDRAMEDLAPHARQKAVRLINAVPAGIGARADANRIQQVLSNLLDNAIKYGRVEGTVEVSARIAEDGRVEVAVRDDGPGIPPEALGRIFERFFRVDKARSREQGGTGLGLSIVKHIVTIAWRQGLGGQQAGPGQHLLFYSRISAAACGGSGPRPEIGQACPEAASGESRGAVPKIVTKLSPSCPLFDI